MSYNNCYEYSEKLEGLLYLGGEVLSRRLSRKLPMCFTCNMCKLGMLL